MLWRLTHIYDRGENVLGSGGPPFEVSKFRGELDSLNSRVIDLIIAAIRFTSVARKVAKRGKSSLNSFLT